MREHLGEIGLLFIFAAIIILLLPTLFDVGESWSLLVGIWVGIVGVFLVRAERSRERRREKREDEEDN
ncbi:MAG: hypothetical protein R6U92_04190 [Bacillota bacterium]